MDSSEIKLDEGVTDVAWNFSCHRFAAASNDGFLRVWDRKDHGTGAFSCTSAWKVLITYHQHSCHIASLTSLHNIRSILKHHV